MPYEINPAIETGGLAGDVVGDGVRTEAALIHADPRTRRGAAKYPASLGPAALDRIPARDERMVLTTVASLRVGARYENASAQLTAALDGAVDRLARTMPDFHLGRFDVRFASMAALRCGEFIVIEVNGAGSNAVHF